MLAVWAFGLRAGEQPCVVLRAPVDSPARWSGQMVSTSLRGACYDGLAGSCREPRYCGDPLVRETLSLLLAGGTRRKGKTRTGAEIVTRTHTTKGLWFDPGCWIAGACGHQQFVGYEIATVTAGALGYGTNRIQSSLW